MESIEHSQRLARRVRPSRRGDVTLSWSGKPDLSGPLEDVSPVDLKVVEVWEPVGVPLAAPTLEEGNSALDAASGAPTHSSLILGEHEAVLSALTAVGDVKLIYLDPPFATGGTFTAEIPVGPRGEDGQQPTMRVPAYADTWGGLAGYLSMMARLLTRLHDLLADDGWLCLHCDDHAAAYLSVLLDEIFGSDARVNQMVWSYGLGNARRARGFPRKHDTLLLYAKSDKAPFTPIRGEVTSAMLAKYRHVRSDGTRFMRSYGKEYDLKGGKRIGSVWDIPAVAPTSRERTGYPTQKPVALLERLIQATTAPGDLILDPCCGAGTTSLAAHRLGRRAIGIDQSPLAILHARKRLVAVGAPFVTLVDGQIDGAAFGTVLDECASARLTRDGDLMSVALVHDGDTPAELEGWAVGTRQSDDANGCDATFTPIWSCFREPPRRALPAVSEPLPAALARKLVVRCYDTVGGWRDAVEMS